MENQPDEITRAFNMLIGSTDPNADPHRVLESLSELERDTLLQMLQEADTTGASPLLRDLWEHDYKYKPVDIVTFLKEDYYLGRIGAGIYPKWWDVLEEIVETNCWDVVFSGSIGTGKTTIATILLTYITYRLSCLRDPQAFYELIAGSRIALGLYNIFKYKVDVTSFSVFEACLSHSPYFKEKFSRDDKKSTQIILPNNVYVTTGASELHAIGESLFGAVIDEANFMRKQGASEQEIGQAHKLHEAIQRRMESRFSRLGRTPGVLVIVSSARDVDDYVEKHVQQRTGQPGFYHAQFALWDVKPKHNYSGKKFQVAIGTQTKSSVILQEGEEPFPGAEVIDVPIEHYEAFDTDVDASIRDLAGKPTYGMNLLIPQRERVHACVDPDRKHPFTKEIITLDHLNEVPIEDYLDFGAMFNVIGSRYRPKVNPTQSRWMHVDLALSGDYAGMAMGHMSGMKHVRRQRNDGSHYVVQAPLLYYDFMLGIKPPQGKGQIDLQAIVAFIIALQTYGFDLQEVTFDGYESASSVQILQKNAINAYVMSVDRNDEAYLHLKQLILEQRANYYDYERFMREITRVQRDLNREKVDHPPGGSKDVSDGAAGVAKHCMTQEGLYTPEYRPQTGTELDRMFRKAGEKPVDEGFDWVASDYKDNVNEVR